MKRSFTVGRVVGPDCIGLKRTKTDSRVLVSRAQKKCKGTYGYVSKTIDVAIERFFAQGCIVDARGIIRQRRGTDRRVAQAVSVAEERLETDRRVADAGCEAKERIIPFRGVLTGIASARCRENCSRCGRKCKACESEQCDRGTGNIRYRFYRLLFPFVFLIYGIPSRRFQNEIYGPVWFISRLCEQASRPRLPRRKVG